MIGRAVTVTGASDDSARQVDDRTRSSLSDIVRFAELAQQVVSRGRAVFDSDALLPLAAEAVVLKLGEAITRLPTTFTTAHPEIPFREVRGMRNLMAHRYELVDPTILWTALSVDIPLLASQMQALLRLGDNRPMTDNTPDPDFADAPLRILEDDENVPPRPEEVLADLERAEPDPH